MNAEKMLRSLVKHSMGSKKRRRRGSMGGLGGMAGGLKGQIGLGALGVAIAAFEHFKQGGSLTSSSPSGGTGTAAPPSGSMPVSRPPAPPSHAGAGAVPASPVPPTPRPSAASAAPPPPPQGRADADASIGVPEPDQSTDEAGVDDSLILIRSMIAAANADGVISAEEKQAMIKALEESGGTEADRARLEAELLSPRSVDELLAAIKAHGERPDLATQVYASSLLAIDVDTEAERIYLSRLAQGLSLSEETVRLLEEQLGGSDPQ